MSDMWMTHVWQPEYATFKHRLVGVWHIAKLILIVFVAEQPDTHPFFGIVTQGKQTQVTWRRKID